MKHIPLDRPRPPVFRHIGVYDWHRTFPWRQRIAILFGMPMLVIIRIASAHNPGKCQPFIAGKLTELLTPDDVMEAEIKREMGARPLPPHE